MSNQSGMSDAEKHISATLYGRIELNELMDKDPSMICSAQQRLPFGTEILLLINSKSRSFSGITHERVPNDLRHTLHCLKYENFTHTLYKWTTLLV